MAILILLIGGFIIWYKYPALKSNKINLYSPNFTKSKINYDIFFDRVIKDNKRKTYLDNNGYWRFKDSDMLVHRYVAKKSLGRNLKFNEVVHHQDGDKWNNRPYNLYVCTQTEHENIHMNNLKQCGNWYGN